jgi:response regulator RpfG family c-di-GMP phosphodiesterase
MGVSKGSATGGKHVGKIRVVLADDHPEVIARIRGTLGDEFEVVEEADNGDKVVTAVLALDPDVLVTDISMPLVNGLEAARATSLCPIQDGFNLTLQLRRRRSRQRHGAWHNRSSLELGSSGQEELLSTYDSRLTSRVECPA